MAVWHDDPDLLGRFHPDYPDDVQVVIHEGSFRFTDKKPEVAWGRVFAKLEMVMAGGQVAYAYKATLLNDPFQITSLTAGQEILLLARPGFPYAVRVTHEYIVQRLNYDITPCDKCGLPELFDPVDTLRAKVFPQLQEQIAQHQPVLPLFTSFCPMCGGIMVVKHKSLKDSAVSPTAKTIETPKIDTPKKKPWWKIW